MNIHTLSQPQWRLYSISFWIAEISILAGLMLSIFSWLGICLEQCSGTNQYVLFGLPFGLVGIAFFILLLSLNTLSLHYPFLSTLVSWMLASALGAEVVFIAIQKYQIGQWCPVCLSIAFSLLIAGITFITSYIHTFCSALQNHNQGQIMRSIKTGLTSISFFMIGLIVAFFGVAKPDLAHAAATAMKDRLALGDKTSPVEIYVITDWFCPSCHKTDPYIEELYPNLQSKAKIYFIDFPIHRETLNFSPYHLAFLINNKDQYFQARHLLVNIAKKTKSPTDEDINREAQKLNLTFKELPYLDVKTGLEFFDKVTDQYDISATPTVVITNPKTNKTVKLEGSKDITEKKILNAIETTNKAS